MTQVKHSLTAPLSIALLHIWCERRVEGDGRFQTKCLSDRRTEFETPAFPKRLIRQPCPLHAMTGQMCGGEKVCRILTHSSSLFACFKQICLLLCACTTKCKVQFRLGEIVQEKCVPLSDFNDSLQWQAFCPTQLLPHKSFAFRHGQTTFRKNWFVSSTLRP